MSKDVSKDRKTRAVEAEVEIAAPVDAVWRAVSEAEELTRWFPLEASVVPGRGGTIRIAWDQSWASESRIEIWEPPRRLRTVTEQAPFDASGQPIPGAAPLSIAVDYVIEATGGGARLRLVHSGFGAGADWDGEVEGTRRGWSLELLCLRHYLERHRGRDRRAALIHLPTAAPAAGAWAAMTREYLGGFAAESLRASAPYSIRLSTGDELSGDTLLSAPCAFSGTATEFNDGLFRFAVDALGGRTLVHVGLETWGVEAERVADFKARSEAALRSLLPEA